MDSLATRPGGEEMRKRLHRGVDSPVDLCRRPNTWTAAAVVRITNHRLAKTASRWLPRRQNLDPDGLDVTNNVHVINI